MEIELKTLNKTAILELYKLINPNVPSFFQSYAWLSAWLNLAAPYVKTVVFLKDTKPIAFCFLGKEVEKRLKFFNLKSLYLNDTGVTNIDMIASEYNQIIGHKDYIEECTKTLLHYLRNDYPEKWDRLITRRMCKNHADYYKDNHFNFDIFRHEECSYIYLNKAREQNKDILDMLSSNTRYQIRRAIKRYQQDHGDIIFLKAANPEQGVEWFLDMRHLHEPYWQAKGHKGAYFYPELVEIHKTLILNSFEQIEMIKLQAGDHLIGYLYNMLNEKKVYFYMCGLNYDVHNHIKPGLVAHYLCATEHLKKGRDIYDFMAGDQRYKYNLGVEAEPMISFALEKNHPLILLGRFKKFIQNKLRR